MALQLINKIDELTALIDKQTTSKPTKEDEKENEINFQSKKFLLSHMQRSMDFFNPHHVIDQTSGGYYHFFGDDGSIYDKTTRVLVTQARFIFSYAIAYQYLPDSDKIKKQDYFNIISHGIKYLREKFRNQSNGGYHWILGENGLPTDSKIYTYGLAFVLLAYSKGYYIGIKECKEYILETYNLMEKYLFENKYGLYAEEADSNWNKTDYRSQSGNLHSCEALISAYQATKDVKYFNKALLIADNVCNKLGGLCHGLIWEHYNNDWTIDMTFNNDSDELTIFRPWGIQPGHQVEWARLLIMLNYYVNRDSINDNNNKPIWLVNKAIYLFDIAFKQAWDDKYGGLAYSFEPNGNVCDWDKIFWVQCESIGTAAMLAIITNDNNGYWDKYNKLWKICWKYFIDHKHGSWYRRCNRQFEKYFLEKTKHAQCVDPDYHIMGALDGALMMMQNKGNK